MKRLLFFLIIHFIFNSCSQDYENRIIGKWTITDLANTKDFSISPIVFEFTESGTFITINYLGDTFVEQPANYNVVDSFIIVSTDTSNSDFVISDISETLLVLKTEQNIPIRLKRFSEEDISEKKLEKSKIFLIGNQIINETRSIGNFSFLTTTNNQKETIIVEKGQFPSSQTEPLKKEFLVFELDNTNLINKFQNNNLVSSFFALLLKKNIEKLILNYDGVIVNIKALNIKSKYNTNSLLLINKLEDLLIAKYLKNEELNNGLDISEKAQDYIQNEISGITKSNEPISSYGLISSNFNELEGDPIIIDFKWFLSNGKGHQTLIELKGIELNQKKIVIK